jgi:hypothetical protein
VLTTLSAARTGTLLGRGAGAKDALMGGYHLSFAVGAGLLLAAILVAALVLRPRRSARTEPGPARAARPADQPEQSPASAAQLVEP